MVPISVRADAERGALGNRVAAMYAPLPVEARRPGRALRDRPRRDEGPQGVRPGGRRRGDHRLAGLRAADRARPGRAAAVAPALLQRRRDQRARPAGPALHAGPQAARHLPAGPAGAQHGARDRDHVLRRARCTSGCSATTTRCRTSTSSPPSCATRSPSSPPRPASARARPARTRVRRFLGGLLIVALSLASVIAGVIAAAVARRRRGRKRHGAGRAGRGALPGRAGRRGPRRAR